MARSKSSKQWLKEHHSDTYVKRSKQEGYRARSVYKLQEIQQSHKILKPGMIVVDLGAAPGSWSEFVVQVVGSQGKVFAVDILPIKPIKDVIFIQGDFTDEKVLESLLNKTGASKVDAILSDMAPNLSGCSITDQARSVELLEAAFNFAKKNLKAKGIFLCKAFQGEDFQNLLKKLKTHFSEVKTIKPPASRSRSREVFLLAYDVVESKIINKVL